MPDLTDVRPADAVAYLEIEDAWLVDPSTGREGRGSLTVDDGRIVEIAWRSERGRSRAGTGEPPATGKPRRQGVSVAGGEDSQILVAPGLIDLHAHLREPGGEDAETIATGLAAAAHGGFTAVGLMPDTHPALDRSEAVTRVRTTAAATGSPVRALPYGTITLERQGKGLAPLPSLAGAGAVAFTDDPVPLDDPDLLRAALVEAGLLGRCVVQVADDRALTAGAEANEGLTATILGLQGAPAGAEAAGAARAIAVLRQVVAEAPHPVRPRLHLAHVSTRLALDVVRAAKAEGLPVTCDVTPYHLTLHEGWVAGDRRYAWDIGDAPWAGGPADAGPYDSSTRVDPPLRSATDAMALLAGVEDGTVDAIATDHAPHRSIDKDVPYGEALPGISGLETALSLVLAAVDAGALSLGAAVRALTSGPWKVLGGAEGPLEEPALREGALADLLVVDRADRWTVTGKKLASKGRNTPLLGCSLAGVVLLTVAGGRIAYMDPSLD